MKGWEIFFVIVIILLCIAQSTDKLEGFVNNLVSNLYGKQGEKWKKNGRLLDYSFAGKRINTNITAQPINIKTVYGAVGDGETDDTAAFKKAFEQANGVLYIPSGKYIIKDIVRRYKNKNPLVVRGDGQNKTVIHFPKSMRELFGKPNDELSKWAFKPCFFEINMEKSEAKICDITQNAKIGDTIVYTSAINNLKKGDWVNIRLYDTPSGDLHKIVYGRADMIPTEDLGKQVMELPNKVHEIGNGYVKLVRPLPIDVKTVCTPQIHTLNRFTSIFGIENMTFTAAYKKYNGHLQEDGYNMLSLKNVVNGWVKNIKFHNADIALKLGSGCHFCTVDTITHTSDFDRSGHHGCVLSGCSDNLIKNFNYKMTYVHDTSVSGLAVQNVFSNGKGINVNFDHHRVGPYGNLFTGIHLGKGTRYFASSGQSQRGAWSGQKTTFWGLSTDSCTRTDTKKCDMLSLAKNEGTTKKLKTPRPWGIGLNYVGTFSNPPRNNSSMAHVTQFEDNRFEPFNLYEDMVKSQRRRLGQAQTIGSVFV